MNEADWNELLWEFENLILTYGKYNTYTPEKAKRAWLLQWDKLKYGY